jgi:hypothetical protein
VKVVCIRVRRGTILSDQDWKENCDRALVIGCDGNRRSLGYESTRQRFTMTLKPLNECGLVHGVPTRDKLSDLTNSHIVGNRVWKHGTGGIGQWALNASRSNPERDISYTDPVRMAGEPREGR